MQVAIMYLCKREKLTCRVRGWNAGTERWAVLLWDPFTATGSKASLLCFTNSTRKITKAGTISLMKPLKFTQREKYRRSIIYSGRNQTSCLISLLL